MTVVYTTAKKVADDMGLGWDTAQTVGSNTQNTSIFAPTTAGQRYSIGDEVRLYNSDGATEDATVTGVTYGSSYTTLTVGALTNESLFTTAKNTTVQIMSYFTNLSTPTKAIVERWIEEAQGRIDSKCKRSWMGAGSGTGKRWKGYLRWRPTYPLIMSDIYEYFKIKLPYPNPVLPLSTGSNDSLKVWNGAEETEYVDVYTESRTGDFWLDDKGWLMINRARPWPGNRAIYISYRYGYDDVPDDIQEACNMMVVNKFLKSNLYNNQPLAEGATSETWPYTNSRGYSWTQIKDTLKQYRRIIHL